MTIFVTDLTLDHVRSCSGDIRPEDTAEWEAASGFGVYKFLLLVGLGDYAKVALDADGEVLCFWGAAFKGTEGGLRVADVWLVATTKGERRAIALHHHLKDQLAALHERWEVLECAADERNEKHLKWLRWLGFKPGHQCFYTKSPNVPYRHHSKVKEGAVCASQL